MASAYRLRQTNIPQYDTAAATYVALPGMQTTGVELDVNGQIAPGWTVAATFSTAKYEYLSPSPADRSDFVIAQPRTRYSVFTAYEIQHGPLRNLGGSIGLYGFSSSIAGTVGTYTAGYTWQGVTYPQIYTRKAIYIGSQNEVDANITYKLNRLNLNFGIKNLFDKNLYSLGLKSDYIPLAAPRTFMLTATYNFF